MSDHKVVVRNFEGYITTYEEPQEYKPHDSKTCKYCQHKRQEPGQEGVSGLLESDKMAIKPEGFDKIHRQRNGSASEPDKPKPVKIASSGEEL
jgi:lysine 2,3-aminomutase